MGRLFWKIFFTFWLTLILVLLASNWGTALYWQASNDSQRFLNRDRFAHMQIQAIADILEFDGIAAVKRMLKRKHRSRSSIAIKINVLDNNGKIILSRPSRHKGDKNKPIKTISKMVNAVDGMDYQIIGIFTNKTSTASFFRPFLRPFKHSPGLVLLWLGIAILITAIVCFWLAWYITFPIKQLQIASRRLASGDLDVRVAKDMGKRRDEIADLGKDFDHMAEHLQKLVLAQKQLLSDISHELRSPLARLQLAIGLTRQKKGQDVVKEMDRIEQEIIRLDDLVGQVLTLSRLETGSKKTKEDFVDIALLLENIVKDADFEAVNKHRCIILNSQKTWTLRVNTELLHRALENVIRNAVYYTAVTTQVTVSLKESHTEKGYIEIQICDSGPGVPEDQLTRLFEPFVRISSSRNRDSGGYGLGLAIAERAIHLHQGKIFAQNRDQGGLCVIVLLPVPS